MKDAVSVNEDVVHIYIWDEYVAVLLANGVHMFYKPSFVGVLNHFPYRRTGGYLVSLAFLSLIGGMALSGINDPLSSLLTMIAIALAIIGFVLLLIPRRSLVVESIGGLRIEYVNIPNITQEHLRKLAQTLGKPEKPLNKQ